MIRKPSDRSRSGVTLVELCVATLILCIIFFGWTRINNIKAVNRESLRYAAVEKAAGMLESVDSSEAGNAPGIYFSVAGNGSLTKVGSSAQSGKPPDSILPLFGNDCPVGYQFHTEKGTKGSGYFHVVNPGMPNEHGDACLWLVVDLFDRHGSVRSDVDSFVSLRVFCKALAQ